MNRVDWSCCTMEECGVWELYELLRLRVDVFVVEQNCLYPELDGYDHRAYHLLGELGGELLAYARFFLPGDYYEDEVALGRFVVKRTHRGQGIGHSLLERSFHFIEEKGPGASIRISAQEYLVHFYRAYGFFPCSSSYLEDGIPHVEMRRD